MSDLATPRALEGRNALVTGASRGIGAAIARALAARGANVALAARSEDALERLAQDIRTAGGSAVVIATDINDDGAIERMVESAVTQLGSLDCAVNNAGVALPPTPLAEVAVDDFDAVFRTNLHAAFVCMKHEIPAIEAAGGGSIVNLASTASHRGRKGLAAYVAMKHGLIGLTKVAALDYASAGVRINALSPGPVETERLREVPRERLEPIVRETPMERMGRMDEVAAAAVWLCSDASSFVTGTSLVVDGGRLAAGA